MEYLTFDLEIAPKQRDVYPVAARSEAGEARHQMHFPLEGLALDQALLQVQPAVLQASNVWRGTGTLEEQTIQSFGQMLFEALMEEHIRRLYDASIARATQQGKGMRMRLDIQAPELALLPWEYMYDPLQGEFLCFLPATVLERSLALPRSMPPPGDPEKVPPVAGLLSPQHPVPQQPGALVAQDRLRLSGSGAIPIPAPSRANSSSPNVPSHQTPVVLHSFKLPPFFKRPSWDVTLLALFLLLVLLGGKLGIWRLTPDLSTTPVHTVSTTPPSPSGISTAQPSPFGPFTEFQIPFTDIFSVGITAGPDGNLWVTGEAGDILSITPSGNFTQYPLPDSASEPESIALGPDGNLWFTESFGGQIGYITPDGQKIAEFSLRNPSTSAYEITAGPDGNLWFTEGTVQVPSRIGRITPSGSITEFPLPNASSQPEGITLGPDGNLWFTERAGGKIGRITPSGSITEFLLAPADNAPTDIIAGPDGNLWFTLEGGGVLQIGRITPSGSITELALPESSSQPEMIADGPDGNLWFTAARSIWRFTRGK